MIDDEPIIQVGLLWFEPDGGEQLYREYLAASRPIVERHLGRSFVADSYARLAMLRGELDPDAISINEFPSASAITALLQDPDYPPELLRRATTRVEIIQLRQN